MNFSKQRQGELLIILEAFMWSFLPIFTIIIYKYIPPLLTYGFNMLFAAVFFLWIIIIQKRWKEFKNKRPIYDVLLATFFINVLYYFFVFAGFRYTTAGNAGIVLLMEIFFTFVIFEIWSDEKSQKVHVLGAILMIIGCLLVLFPGELKFRMGDLLIVAGTFFAPIGNFFQKRARKSMSSVSILFIRASLSSILVFSISYFIFHSGTFINFSIALPYLLITGILIFGVSKILWLEGIHRINVSKAISLSSIAPAFTLVFAYLILKEVPTIWQVSGFIPILIGGYLITRK